MVDRIEVPNRLYKFERVCAESLENLNRSEVFFSSPLGFNDPFDCALQPRISDPSDERVEEVRAHYIAQGMPSDAEQEAREISTEDLKHYLCRIAKTSIAHLINDFAGQNGVSCFSSDNSNLLMWSHYSNGGKGFCLEFDTKFDPFKNAKPIRYSNLIPEVSPVALALREYRAERARELFETKSIDWAYEEEWRVFHQNHNQPFFFEPAALTGIYLGPKISQASTNQIVDCAREKFPRAILRYGIKSNREYRVDFIEEPKNP